VVPQLHDIPGISGDLVISARSNSCSFNDHETDDANAQPRQPAGRDPRRVLDFHHTRLKRSTGKASLAASA